MLMRKTKFWIVLAVALLASSTLIPEAGLTQTAVKITSEGGICMLPEVGGIVVLKGGKVIVEMVMDASQRPKQYADVDLKKDDIVSMVNGKRVKTVEELQQTYDSLAVGGSLKLGIKRGQELRLVSIVKADPDKLPGRRMMQVKTMEGDDQGDSASGGPVLMKMDASDPNVIPLVEMGLLLGVKDDAVVVTNVMPMASQILGDVTIKEGDVLATVNGQPVNDKAGFLKTYSAIKVGDNVEFGFVRGDQKIAAEVAKPEPQARMIMKR